MPRRDGHRSHRFSASRDPGVLRRAASITATRTSDAVIVALTPREIGHALPTGDIFRRLRVLASGAGVTREVFLGRKTKLGADQDDRPFAGGGRRTDVSIPITAPGQPIAWRVVYERVEHPTSTDETNAVIDGAIELASGVLPGR